MKYLRPARVAAVVVAGTLGFGAQASLSGAEEPVEGVSLHCHAAADGRSFQSPLPTAAIVVDRVPCFLPPDQRRTNDARLVVTPSLHVHLTCHLQPAS